MPGWSGAGQGHCSPSGSNRSSRRPPNVGRGGRRDLGEHVGRAAVVPRRSERPGHVADHLPVRSCPAGRWQRGTHPLHPPLGVGEGAVLLEPASGRQHEVSQGGGLAEEEVLDHQQVEASEGADHARLVGLALGEVLALRPEGAELAAFGRADHARHREAGSHGGCGTPKFPKSRADRRLVEGLVAGH